MFVDNPCHGTKPVDAFAEGDNYFENTDCDAEGVLEQAGANVTKGYQGGFDVGDRMPITTDYFAAGLCPVNVHWHLGTEHYSAGEYDWKHCVDMHVGETYEFHWPHSAAGACGTPWQ